MARVSVLAALTAGLLAVTCATAAGADSDAPDSIAAPDSTLVRARQLLRGGQPALASRMVKAALTTSSDDALQCLSGEVAFRLAHFDEASDAFAAALARNPDNARAHWGLGRIDQLHFRSAAARDRFARAYALDPRDTDIILSYEGFVADPASRATLLRNVAALSLLQQPERAEQAVAQLKILERLQGRRPARLISAEKPYRLPLSGFRPSGSDQSGLLLAVRFNEGRPLRLLLDSGARGLSIDARSARNLNLETLVASRLRGFGDAGAAGSRLALARTLGIGDLEFAECLVEVSDHRLTADADGVVGLDLFERFQIHLSAAERSLDLTPAPSSPDRPSGAVAALGLRNLLLVDTRLGGGKSGLFLIDTGAAFTAVARELLPADAQSRPVAMQGTQGSLAGALRIGPLEFSIGSRSLLDTAPLAMDLRRMSETEGIEISGVLGYSTLGRSPLTLDLRNGTVEFGKPR